LRIKDWPDKDWPDMAEEAPRAVVSAATEDEDEYILFPLGNGEWNCPDLDDVMFQHDGAIGNT
jgi:hypothetical protein